MFFLFLYISVSLSSFLSLSPSSPSPSPLDLPYFSLFSCTFPIMPIRCVIPFHILSSLLLLPYIIFSIYSFASSFPSVLFLFLIIYFLSFLLFFLFLSFGQLSCSILASVKISSPLFLSYSSPLLSFLFLCPLLSPSPRSSGSKFLFSYLTIVPSNNLTILLYPTFALFLDYLQFFPFLSPILLIILCLSFYLRPSLL